MPSAAVVMTPLMQLQMFRIESIARATMALPARPINSSENVFLACVAGCSESLRSL
jgi:hypothetical protein